MKYVQNSSSGFLYGLKQSQFLGTQPNHQWNWERDLPHSNTFGHGSCLKMSWRQAGLSDRNKVLWMWSVEYRGHWNHYLLYPLFINYGTIIAFVVNRVCVCVCVHLIGYSHFLILNFNNSLKHRPRSRHFIKFLSSQFQDFI